MSIKMVEVNEQELYDQVIGSMERELGEVLNPGDVCRIAAGNILSAVCSLINEGNANTRAQRLPYSFGSYLDDLSCFVGYVPRLQPATATVGVKFTVNAPEGHTGVIAAGATLTADGQRYFEVRERIPFTWQSQPFEVTAYAVEGGAAYNGYPAGSINTVVRPIPFLAVTNVSPSVGGTDIEEDDSYRERIRMAPRSFSAAGTDASYEFYALSADSAVGSVWSRSETPSNVTITVLLKGGGIPSQSILDKVTSAVTAREVKAVADQIAVSAPKIVSYDITVTYFISAVNSADEVTIKSAVESAYEEYKVWQRSELGRAINVDQLRFMTMGSGACRVDLQGPAYTPVPRDSIAVASAASSIMYGGLI